MKPWDRKSPTYPNEYPAKQCQLNSLTFPFGKRLAWLSAIRNSENWSHLHLCPSFWKPRGLLQDDYEDILGVSGVQKAARDISQEQPGVLGTLSAVFLVMVEKHAIRLQNKGFASGYNSSLPIPALGSALQWLKSCGLLEFTVQSPKRGRDKEMSPDIILTFPDSVSFCWCVISFSSFHPTPGCWNWQPLVAAGVYHSRFWLPILFLLLVCCASYLCVLITTD